MHIVHIYIYVYNARGTSRITKSYVTRGGEEQGEGERVEERKVS